jgi:hypothetical protein
MNGRHRDRFDHGNGKHGDDDREGKNQWRTKICANNTIAQMFLNQTQNVIKELKANASYTEVLRRRAATVAYLENENGATQLAANCTEYLRGLQTARQTDRQTEKEHEKYDQDAIRRVKEVLQSLVQNRSPVEDIF